jgi:glycosyltransferase involved in cell wall biosynthesis
VKIAVVIPTRGDRKMFLDKCLEYMIKQTRQADHVIIVDFPPKDASIDLVPRYRDGFTKAFELYKCDIVICIEDDDWYAPNYIELMEGWFEKSGRPDVLGINHTIYYNIMENKYVILNHPGRASMMQMAVSPKILDIEWCADDYAYLDWHLWVKEKALRKIAVYSPHVAIGIKHGIGLCGGGGHKQGWKHYQKEDKDWSFLSSIIKNKTDLNFYKTIKAYGTGYTEKEL